MERPTTPNQSAIAPDVRAWLSVFPATRHWLVVPHARPDADTLGSAFAMAALLRQLGCQAQVVCADPVVPRFDFLPGAESVQVGAPSADWPLDSGLVTLDAAEWDRLGLLATTLAQYEPRVNIDHHISNQRFGTHNWIDVPSAATGEMVALLYAHFGLPLDADAATCLYAALVTDTGRFRYTATTPRTLEVASRLLESGAAAEALMGALYERRRPGELWLCGRALSRLTLEAGGRVAWTSLALADFVETRAGDEEAEGIVEQLRELEGVEIFYILREVAENSVRVSLRAKPGHDVNAVARHFGGGGHLLASGCTIVGGLPEAERALREVVLEHLDREGP